MAREARFGDIPGIAALVERAAERSEYASLTLDVPKVKQGALAAIRARQAWVAEDGDGAVCGVLAGATESIYGVFRERVAFDQPFMVEPGTPFRETAALACMFLAWAWAQPGVVYVQVSTNGAMPGWERLGGFYRGLGFEPHGESFRMRRAA